MTKSWLAILATGIVVLTPTAGRAADKADSWETLPTDAYPGKRDDISFADARHGWYGTGKGDLYATQDGGAHWAKVASKPGTFIRALGFADENVGFIGNVGVGYYPGVTDTVPLYRTDDGGKTWAPVRFEGAAVAGICAIDVLHTARIFQGALVPHTIITAAGRVGGPAALLRSVDDGKTWQSLDMSRWTGMILDVHFVDERTGFVAASSSGDAKTTNAQILMTRDGGASWTEVYRSNRPSELVWKMSWPSAKIGFGTVMSYDQSNVHKVVVKTTDGGKTWRELPLVDNGKAVELGIGFVDPSHGWVGTTAGGFKTDDGGKTFTTSPIAVAANKFRIVPQGQGQSAIYVIGTAVQRLAWSAGD